VIFIYGFLAGSIITFIIGFVVFKTLKMGLYTSTKSTLNETLNPFKDEILDYKKSLDLTREKNIENTATLRAEINSMMLMSKRMEKETSDLTNALKGDVKSQGNWGELILERSIEISGLTLGREFSLQGKGMNLKSDEGDLYKPDAIIHLPDNFHIIIDSKVSLKSLYQEDYKELKRSLTKHIDELSNKAYQKLPDLNSPDYVIMFIPLESIMPIMFTEFPDIIDYAARKNITLATPITLMPILKTVSSLWRVDNQNKNGVEIAKKAGQLYDKFVSLYEGLVDTNTAIDKLQKSHQESLKRLNDGRGNIIGKVEELKELGAKSSKSINN